MTSIRINNNLKDLFPGDVSIINNTWRAFIIINWDMSDICYLLNDDYILDIHHLLHHLYRYSKH